MPVSFSDERLEYRRTRLLKPEIFALPKKIVVEREVQAILTEAIKRTDLQDLWNTARKADTSYKAMAKAIREEKRAFPLELRVKVSILECELDSQERLLFRGRRWVPESEPLRTGLI